jgi:hypothetical protein
LSAVADVHGAAAQDSQARRDRLAASKRVAPRVIGRRSAPRPGPGLASSSSLKGSEPRGTPRTSPRAPACQLTPYAHHVPLLAAENSVTGFGEVGCCPRQRQRGGGRSSAAGSRAPGAAASAGPVIQRLHVSGPGVAAWLATDRTPTRAHAKIPAPASRLPAPSAAQRQPQVAVLQVTLPAGPAAVASLQQRIGLAPGCAGCGFSPTIAAHGKPGQDRQQWRYQQWR